MREKAVGWLALACLVAVVIVSGKPSFSNASLPPRGIADPVVALQVARNVKEVDAILGEAPGPDREAMRLKQYLDFPFIACYAALYIALTILFFSRTRILAAAAGACGIAAAVFDVRENVAILRIVDVPLARTSQAMVDAIRTAGLTKWTLAFAAAALFGALFLTARNKIWRAIGALDWIAAGLGFYGLFQNRFLLWGSVAIGAELVALTALFLRFRVPLTFRRTGPRG